MENSYVMNVLIYILSDEPHPNFSTKWSGQSQKNRRQQLMSAGFVGLQAFIDDTEKDDIVDAVSGKRHPLTHNGMFLDLFFKKPQKPASVRFEDRKQQIKDLRQKWEGESSSAQLPADYESLVGQIYASLKEKRIEVGTRGLTAEERQKVILARVFK